MGEMADYYLEQELDNLESNWYPAPELRWTTKDGDSIPVSKMTKSHLKNTIKLLKRRKEDADFWIAIFEDELKERK